VARRQVDHTVGVLGHPALPPWRDGPVLGADHIGGRARGPRHPPRDLGERDGQLRVEPLERPLLGRRVAVPIQRAGDTIALEPHLGSVVAEADGGHQLAGPLPFRERRRGEQLQHRLAAVGQVGGQIGQSNHRLVGTGVGDHHAPVAVANQQGGLADGIKAGPDRVGIAVEVGERLRRPAVTREVDRLGLVAEHP
jgi:hypothetical protein